jgi:hypothetical protein
MNRKFLIVLATTILFLLSTIGFAFSQRIESQPEPNSPVLDTSAEIEALERDTDALRSGKR